MSLHNMQTTLTPDELCAIQNCITQCLIAQREKRAETLESCTELDSADLYRLQCAETASKWAAAQSELLYETWEALPEGSHLKEAYRDDIWMHSDRDLAAMPKGGWEEKPLRKRAPRRPTK